MKHFIAAPAFARQIGHSFLIWLPVAVALLAAGSSLLASLGKAHTFGSGASTFEIEFVTIGAPGNSADTTGAPNPAGSVSNQYRIGKYEISEQMINEANAQASLDGALLGITIDTRGPDKPATRARSFEAAQFVNWLNTSSGATPAYKFDNQGVFQLRDGAWAEKILSVDIQ